MIEQAQIVLMVFPDEFFLQLDFLQVPVQELSSFHKDVRNNAGNDGKAKIDNCPGVIWRGNEAMLDGGAQKFKQEQPKADISSEGVVEQTEPDNIGQYHIRQNDVPVHIVRQDRSRDQSYSDQGQHRIFDDLCCSYVL